MNEKEQARGLFWCSLLRPLIEGETEDEDALRCLREIAAQEHVFPDGQRRKVSVSTLRRKWRAFQKGRLRGPVPQAAERPRPVAQGHAGDAPRPSN